MLDFTFEVYLIITTLISFTLGLFFLYLYLSKHYELQHYWMKTEMRERGKRSFKKKLGYMVLKSARKLGPRAKKLLAFRNADKDENLLKLAGNPNGLTLEDFYGLKIALLLYAFIFFLIMGFLGFKFLMILSALLLFAGFMGPDIWLSSRAKERQRKIGEELPDFLDTVSVMLLAGSSLDISLKLATEHMKGPLVDEFKKFLQELQLGVPRKTAYENLIRRNTSQALHTLVQSLIQGSDLGVPVAKTFSIQAEDLRSSRATAAKEKAAKASPKITLVTTFLIAPAVFILIVGLLVLNLVYNPDAFGVTSFFK